jgi:enoyl-CoA hydratase/carnithine racemase
MDYQDILYEVDQGIAKIVINRPDALNSLTPKVLSELHSAVQEAGQDNQVGVIVLTGAGRAFCAGVDLKALEKPAGADVGDDLNNAARDLQCAIEDVPKPVIGMVNGFCLTGGLELALACDFIVAADEARFGDTHTRWGLRCTWGMSRRLPGRVGEGKARELTYTAEMISGVEAARIGLANKSVPVSDLEKTVREIAEKILTNSAEAVAAHKHLYSESRKETMAKGLEREYTTMPEISDTLERMNGFARKG